MTTLAQLKADPSDYLGVSDDPANDAEMTDQFINAVEHLLADDDELTEGEAIDIIWGDGDFWPNVQRILGLS